jgi:hypothetical protein
LENRTWRFGEIAAPYDKDEDLLLNFSLISLIGLRYEIFSPKLVILKALLNTSRDRSRYFPSHLLHE